MEVEYVMSGYSILISIIIYYYLLYNKYYNNWNTIKIYKNTWLDRYNKDIKYCDQTIKYLRDNICSLEDVLESYKKEIDEKNKKLLVKDNELYKNIIEDYDRNKQHCELIKLAKELEVKCFDLEDQLASCQIKLKLVENIDVDNRPVITST